MPLYQVYLKLVLQVSITCLNQHSLLWGPDCCLWS